MNNGRVKDIFLRYGFATVGLFLVSLGVALSIISNLGTAPLSCAAYVLNLKITSISVGTFNVLINMLYILIQLVLLRRDFKVEYLMQVIATVLFGFFIDASMWMLSSLAPSAFLSKLLLTILAGVVTAFGVSMEVAAKAWMLSAEMTVSAYSTVFHKDFGKVKISMDSLLVVVAAVLAVAFFGNPVGSGHFTGITDWLLARTEGIVIGLGTLILAFLPGYLMRFTDPLVRKVFSRWRW